MNEEPQVFADELSDVSFVTQQPTEKPVPDASVVRQTAENAGFASRPIESTVEAKESKTKAATPARMPNLNCRVKPEDKEAFKAIGQANEPPWPDHYTFKRAIAALQRELSDTS
jgi:hypothetical protein